MIRKLLQKDEHTRLGSRAGAADIKQHPFFKNTNFALLRNMTPPILPAISKPNGIDAINFRKIQESMSLDLEADGLRVMKKIEKSNPFEKFDSRKFLFMYCYTIIGFWLLIKASCLFSYVVSQW